jgi:hypothetical protein
MPRPRFRQCVTLSRLGNGRLHEESSRFNKEVGPNPSIKREALKRVTFIKGYTRVVITADMSDSVK